VQNQELAAALAPRSQRGSRRITLRLLDSSTSRLTNSGNKARMSMKTKGNDEMSAGLRCAISTSAHGLTTATPSTKMGAGAFSKRELRRSFVVPIRPGLLRMTGLRGEFQDASERQPAAIPGGSLGWQAWTGNSGTPRNDSRGAIRGAPRDGRPKEPSGCSPR
jgi:hypothetical protein